MVNPLLQRSELPYQWPDFAKLGADEYLQAVQTGVTVQNEEIRVILDNSEPASFANSFLPLERSGQILRRAQSTYFTVLLAHGTESMLAVQAEITGIGTRQEDEIYLNAALHTRLKQVELSALSGEDLRLATETLKRFELAGATLDEASKTRLRELNAQIAQLSSEFSKAALESMNAHAVLFDTVEELAGLDESAIDQAAEAARRAGHEQGFLITLVSPTQQPVMAELQLAASRRKVYESSLSRGLDDDSTLTLASEMARLRAERAQLLGYATHADAALAQATAPDTAAVAQRLTELTQAATANARAEAEALAEIAGVQRIDPWDWQYYSQAVLREKYALDSAALRPYFELERVLHDGVFATATRLYGLSFSERTDLPLYHPDLRVWEVFNSDGSALGLFAGDFFARDTKKGGAWMISLRDAAADLGEQPVVTNTLNISKPVQGQPALLTLDETRTLFHEFGHALHGLFSNGKYASLAGTSVPRDFVEFPSQVNEMWLMHPEVVSNYAVHYHTGEALPQEIIDKIRAAQLWGEGFATTEYLAASVLDWAWHTLKPGTRVEDPLAFERQALLDFGFDPDLIPPRYRTAYFQHIFANGYSAGYYSYIWSEVLDADTVQWFVENGGLTRANGDRFRAELLSRGNTREPLESYELFRGRPAEVEPLLQRRGLVKA
ncbi:M3 family metallopeptidase [Glutamicibacter uratoxydans]|uniref:M3 family metallopeptidase n=1 Tax=Glutamicibacter uratoxydans TaxID=43667 RepID=UPI003D6EFB65